MPTITTISFDGDGTLWDFERAMRHALEYRSVPPACLFAIEPVECLAQERADSCGTTAMLCVRHKCGRVGWQ